MFDWYQKATKCYVYLSDVVSDQNKQQNSLPQATWEPAFRKSRWFTRGWTLQELLAPQCVEFFSGDGKKLGDRASLDQFLYEITSIAIEALRGAELSSFDIYQRISWSRCRETTIAEDKAYSLFGIFDVEMCVKYGEGGDKAMKRLLRKIGRPLGSLEMGRNGVVTEDSILKSLDFLVIYDREEDIAMRAPDTFTWIFDSQTSHFPDWLKTERVQVREETTGKNTAATKPGLFWIKGKPGCGKSTLMKYIQKEHETEFLVEKWGGGRVVRASYYFWYKGSKLQKSQEGMIRSILHACLAYRRELIAIVAQDIIRARPDELSEYWNLRRLKETLKKVLLQCESRHTPQAGDSKLKFCFFVDGLDEYEGDHEELAKFVIEIARLPHVKLCVSSRPLNAFERELGHGLFPHIVLQERTSSDIRQYIEKMFDSSPKMKEISMEEPSVRLQITHNITRKASGVFIWVVLVVQLLLESVKNGYSGSQLRHNLDSYPDEIDALYRLIIFRVKKNELKYCFRYLRFVEVTGGTMSLLLLTVADRLLDEPSTPKSFNDEIELQGAKDRINSCCLGLLEIRGKQHTSDKEFELAEALVVFLHKSVFDYLQTDGAQQQLKKFEAISLIPERNLMDATLYLLETRYLNPKSIGRYTWFSSIRLHAMAFLRLARALEEKNGICELKLVNKLDRIMIKLWRFVDHRLPEEENGDIHWVRATPTATEMAEYLADTPLASEPMPSNRPSKHGMHSFVRGAYEAGLYLYAKEKGFVSNEEKMISRDPLVKSKQITNVPRGPQGPVHLPQDIHPPLPGTTGDTIHNASNTNRPEHQSHEFANISTSVAPDHPR